MVALGGWKLWMTIAYFGLAGFGIWLYAVNSRTVRDEAVRIAESASGRQAAVQRCLESRAPLKRISAHVSGVNEFAKVLVNSYARTVAATPLTDPEYRVMKAYLLHLQAAQRQIASVTTFPVPTKESCNKQGQ